MAPEQPPKSPESACLPSGPGIDKWKGITLTYDPQPGETYLTGTQSNEIPYEEPKKPVDRGYYARTFGGKKRR